MKIQSMLELLEAVGFGWLLLLPVSNPLTSVVLLLGLSGEMTNDERNYQSKMACIYVFIIIVVSFYCGQFVMNAFGISIYGLQIAGGLIVAFIGFRMLFPQPSTSKIIDMDKTKKEVENNIAFVPLAMPGTAGPGTIAMVISLASSVNSGTYSVSTWVVYVASILVPLFISITLWFSMRSAGSIMRFMGRSGIDAISRLVGFLLVCMGMQFMINAAKAIVLHFPNI